MKKRKRRLTREVALETGQEVIKKRKREKKREMMERARRERRSIIAKTGNILTGEAGRKS